MQRFFVIIITSTYGGAIKTDKKTDLRIIKTKTAIRSVFLELMQEKGYNSITVKDIAQRAMINRKTFYFHYETKDELYNEIMEDLLYTFSSMHIISDLSRCDHKQQNTVIITFLLNIKAVRREFLIFMNDDTNTTFRDKLKKMLQDALISKDDTLQRMQNDHAFFELLVDVYFNTFIRALRWWLESEQEDPLNFIETIILLFSSRPLEILGLKEETINEYGNLY